MNSRYGSKDFKYRIASGLSEKSENEQVNALVCIMGDKAEKISILFKKDIRRNNVLLRVLFATSAERKTEKADKDIFAVSKKIEINGIFQAFLESKRQKCEESIYIVKVVARPLLSCGASQIQGLDRRINIVEDHASTKLDPMLKFTKLFTGLGKIDIPYEIKEIHPIRVVEHTLAQLKGAKLFTKLDANSEFWKIPLSSESSALTTLFGRFRFKRLPFGISSAPEIFQKRMGQLLEGLEGTLCHMDDILVYGSCQEEHDKRLETVLTRLFKSELTLNKDKCKFAVTTIKFLCHQIDPNGIQLDPKRKRAILEFPKPRSVKERKQFLGMVYFSARFVTNLAEISHPLNKTLSEIEKRYAQIEKEALAITWACEKFKQYIQGLVITLETDHKPLVPIFTSKNIDDLTPRIQRLRLRIMRYSYKIVHTPGKNLIVADTHSRSTRIKVGTQELEQELCAYVQQVVSFMPIYDFRVKEIKERPKDPSGGPGSQAKLRRWSERVLCVIEERTNRHQPLLPSELPSCPWEEVGVDLFAIKSQNYLLINDYYSRYPEIARLEDMTSASVIVLFKSIFPRHGIPLEVRSDNGPRFGSLFKEFNQFYGFTHVTSSPRYPQTLLAYRATPLANGFSPAELRMGRRFRTTILTPTKQHQPPNLKNLKIKRLFKGKNKNTTLIKQKEYENCLH
ncbi:K02A2.6-like [Cordylochernes scorpioides]|uniref:K02A2.6-like n=1 Tax=Cordylochernes scorpioides TaxID=51811 RepID=A0ABY6LHW7_9ARAC|nr:K02A2.6-like [Cordylochernes scorpioides]